MNNLRLKIHVIKARQQFLIKLISGVKVINQWNINYIRSNRIQYFIDRGDDPTLVDSILVGLLHCTPATPVGYKFNFSKGFIVFKPTTNEVNEKFYQITWTDPGCRFLAKALEQLIPDLRDYLGSHPELSNKLK